MTAGHEGCSVLGNVSPMSPDRQEPETDAYPNSHPAPRRVPFVLALMTMLAGCASGFVSGGVATATVQDGRIAVDSRTARAAIGPSGPDGRVSRDVTAICVDHQSGTAVEC